jgi:hypothetical protein
MGTHKLYIRKGDRTSWVDYTGTLDSAANANGAVIAGRVMTLTAGLKLTPGLALAKVPYFALSGLDASNFPDVARTKGMPRSGAVQFATVSAFAAVELVSTAFVSGDTFTPGLPLTALSTAATTLANAGLIGTQAAGTQPVVGYVAPAGKYTDADGIDVVAFYPAYVPGTTLRVA